jgi:hypothetical protein
MAFKPPIKPMVTNTHQSVIESESEQVPSSIGLILSQDQINNLSKLVGKNILTYEDLYDRIKILTTISVAGREITLSPALLHRLKSRAVRQELGEYLEQEIVRLLCGAVGI